MRKEGITQVKQLIERYNEALHKANIFRKTRNRSVKTAVVYELQCKKGRVLKFWKRLPLIDWKKYFGIKRIYCFTPFYIGFRRSTRVKPGMNFCSYVDNHKTFIKNKFPNMYADLIKAASKPKEMWTGSYDSNIPHLRKFWEPNSEKFNVNNLIDIAMKAKSWFKTSSCDFSDPMEMYYGTNYNPSATPGLITSRLLQSNHKGYTFPASLQMAIQQYKYIRKKAIDNYQLWQILAREKHVKLEEDGPVTTRSIMCTEEYVTHLLSWICNKILKSTVSYSDPKFHISGEFDGVKSYNLLKRAENYDYVIDADWSKFDSSIDTSFILAAGAIFLSPSIKEKKDTRMMFYVLSSMARKFVALPPGIVVELNRGNPSGHPAVTILNCYVNLLRWCLIGQRLYGDDFANFMDIEVYGDDTLVFLKDCKNLEKIDDIVKELGFPADPFYPRIYPCKLIAGGLNDGPDFLKRRFSLYGVSWNCEKIFTNMLYPSRNRNYKDEVISIMNYVQVAPGNDEFNNFCYYACIEICESNQDTELRNEVNKFFKNYLIKDSERFTPQSEDDLSGYKFYKSFTCNKLVKQIFRDESELHKLRSVRDLMRMNLIHLHAYPLSYLKEYWGTRILPKYLNFNKFRYVGYLNLLNYAIKRYLRNAFGVGVDINFIFNTT